MKKTSFLIVLSLAALVGCQTASQDFNGKTGYQVEQKTTTTATLTYTLASDRNPNKELRKLQDACQHTLGLHKTYNVKILDTQEIVSPRLDIDQSNLKLGKSHTSFGFSNTPNLNNSQEAYSARQLEETKPNILKVIRFNCS